MRQKTSFLASIVALTLLNTAWASDPNEFFFPKKPKSPFNQRAMTTLMNLFPSESHELLFNEGNLLNEDKSPRTDCFNKATSEQMHNYLSDLQVRLAEFDTVMSAIKTDPLFQKAAKFAKGKGFLDSYKKDLFEPLRKHYSGESTPDKKYMSRIFQETGMRDILDNKKIIDSEKATELSMIPGKQFPFYEKDYPEYLDLIEARALVIEELNSKAEALAAKGEEGGQIKPAKLLELKILLGKYLDYQKEAILKTYTLEFADEFGRIVRSQHEANPDGKTYSFHYTKKSTASANEEKLSEISLLKEHQKEHSKCMHQVKDVFNQLRDSLGVTAINPEVRKKQPHIRVPSLESIENFPSQNSSLISVDTPIVNHNIEFDFKKAIGKDNPFLFGKYNSTIPLSTIAPYVDQVANLYLVGQIPGKECLQTFSYDRLEQYISYLKTKAKEELGPLEKIQHAAKDLLAKNPKNYKEYKDALESWTDPNQFHPLVQMHSKANIAKNALSGMELKSENPIALYKDEITQVQEMTGKTVKLLKMVNEKIPALEEKIALYKGLIVSAKNDREKRSALKGFLKAKKKYYLKIIELEGQDPYAAWLQNASRDQSINSDARIEFLIKMTRAPDKSKPRDRTQDSFSHNAEEIPWEECKEQISNYFDHLLAPKPTPASPKTSTHLKVNYPTDDEDSKTIHIHDEATDSERSITVRIDDQTEDLSSGSSSSDESPMNSRSISRSVTKVKKRVSGSRTPIQNNRSRSVTPTRINPITPECSGPTNQSGASPLNPNDEKNINSTKDTLCPDPQVLKDGPNLLRERAPGSSGD